MLAPLGQRSTFCLLLLLLSLSPARAAPAQAVATEEGQETDTPRRTVERFLSLARAGRYGEAAAELDLNGTPPERGPQLARQLREVLDQRLELDPDKVSDMPAGDLRDGLSEDAEELGRVPGAAGREPVRLQRVGDGTREGGGRWLFSRQTVRRVPGWHGRLPFRWLREHLPEPLWRGGPRGLLYWQWLALPVLVFAAFLLSFLGVRLVRLVLQPITRRTSFRWDDMLLERLGGPGRLILTAALGQVAVSFLALTVTGEQLVSALLKVMLLVGVFSAAWRAVNVLAEAAGTSAWMRSHPATLGVLPLAVRLAHLGLFAVGVVVTLHQLGYEATSLLAGLGIGGLGVALAAQKTVEHLFGGITLTTDQPMRVGDLVKVDAILGVVEHIGLRSTRIRTYDRTVVTIPNGKLADMNIETFAARDRIRLHLTLPLVYGTRAAVVRAIIAAAEALLSQHERVWSEEIIVRLAALGQSGLEVELMCWFKTVDLAEFRALRQEVLLRLLEIVEEHGSAVAFPTRTVLLQREEGRGEAGGGE